MKLSDYVETFSSQIAKEHDKLIQQALRNFGLDIPEDIDPSQFDYTPVWNRIRREDHGRHTKWYVDNQLAAIFSGYYFDIKDGKCVGIMRYKIYDPKE